MQLTMRQTLSFCQSNFPNKISISLKWFLDKMIMPLIFERCLKIMKRKYDPKKGHIVKSLIKKINTTFQCMNILTFRRRMYSQYWSWGKNIERKITIFEYTWGNYLVVGILEFSSTTTDTVGRKNNHFKRIFLGRLNIGFFFPSFD